MADSAITFTPGEVSTYYAARVPNLKRKRAKEWRGPCPIHQGKNDSFAVESATGRWFCHSTCGRGGDILELEADLVGGDFPTRKAEVFRLVGRVEGNSTSKWREDARYRYEDRNGNLLYEVVRLRRPDGKKTFSQERPSGVSAAGTTDPARTVATGGVVVGLAQRQVPYRSEQVARKGKNHLGSRRG